MRIIQLIGDGVEELWEFDEDYTDEQIKAFCKEWQDFEDLDGAFPTFEDFMDDYHELVWCNRIFVDEIHV